MRAVANKVVDEALRPGIATAATIPLGPDARGARTASVHDRTVFQGRNPMTRRIRYAWAAAFDLAWKVGVIAIGLCALMPPADVKDAPERPIPAGAAGQIEAGLIGDDVRVALSVPAGRPFAQCSVRNVDGDELARITYSRKGTLTIVLGEVFPARAGSTASPDGTFRLEVGRDEVAYKLELRPEGGSGFVVDHPRLGVRDGLGFSPEWKLIRGASVLD